MMWMAGNRWVGLAAGGCMAGVFFSATLHAADLTGRWRLEVETLHWSQHQRVTFYDGAGKVVHSEEEDSVDDPAGLLREKTWGSAVQSDGKIEGYYVRSTFCSGQALVRLTGSISEDNRVVFTATFPGRGESCTAQGIPFHVEYSDMVESFEGVYDPEKKLVTGTFTARQDRKYTKVYQGNALWGYASFSVTDTDIVRIGTFSIEVQPKEFMITFDDGPVPVKTSNIVAALKDVKAADGEPVRAGFFMVGDDPGFPEELGHYAGYEWHMVKGSVKKNRPIVKEVAAYHLVGNHTQHHACFDVCWASLYWWLTYGSMKDYVIDEIRQCNGEIRDANVTPLKLFRPPYFVYNPDVRAACSKEELDFQIIMGAGEDRGDAVDIGFQDPKERAKTLIESWKRDEPCVLVFHDFTDAAQNIAEILRYLRRHEVEVLNERVTEGFTLVHFDPKKLPKELHSPVRRATYTIHQSETVRHSVPIDSTVNTVTFTVSWEGSDLDLVLYSPYGTRIDPARARVDSSVKYGERDTYEYYTVSRPNAGAWVMVVSSVNVPQAGEEYTIRVEADTDLALFASAGRPDFALDEQIGIRAELVNGENRVAGATVVAGVRRPDGSVEEQTLYDDGTHGDERAGDGLYANAYSNTSLRGSYGITVSATGMLSGDRYERTCSLTVMVGSIVYGDVDLEAYAVFADHWMAHNCTGPSWCDTADIDQSGAVDIFDLCLLAERWLGRAP